MRRTSGFTLIELMVAMLLTIIIMVIALTVMTGLQTYSESNLNVVRMRQEVRYGLYSITSMVKDAGNRVPKGACLITDDCVDQNTDPMRGQADTDTLSFLYTPSGMLFTVNAITGSQIKINYNDPITNISSVLDDFGTPDTAPFLCVIDGPSYWVIQVDPNNNPNPYTVDASTVTINYIAGGGYIDDGIVTGLTLPTNDTFPPTYKATMTVTRVIPYDFRVKFGTLQRKAGLYNSSKANEDNTNSDWDPAIMIPGRVSIPMLDQATDDKGYITLSSWIWDLQVAYIALDGTITDIPPNPVENLRGIRISILGIAPKTEIMLRQQAATGRIPKATDVPQVRPALEDHPVSSVKTYRRNYFLTSTAYLRNLGLTKD